MLFGGADRAPPPADVRRPCAAAEPAAPLAATAGQRRVNQTIPPAGTSTSTADRPRGSTTSS